MRGIFFARKCMHILLWFIAKDEIQKLDVNKRHTYGGCTLCSNGITIIVVVIIDTGYVNDAFDFA